MIATINFAFSAMNSPILSSFGHKEFTALEIIQKSLSQPTDRLPSNSTSSQVPRYSIPSIFQAWIQNACNRLLPLKVL